MSEPTGKAGSLQVAPEVIEAGLATLFTYDPSFSNERDVVEAIAAIAIRAERERTARHLEAEADFQDCAGEDDWHMKMARQFRRVAWDIAKGNPPQS